METLSAEIMEKKLRKMTRSHNRYLISRNKLCRDFKNLKIGFDECKKLIALNYINFANDVENIFFKEGNN